MSWRRKNLGDAMLADAALEAVRRRLADAAPEAAAAVFYRHESAGLHCAVVLYFSPAAAAVAQSVGARRCAKPAMQGLSRLSGVCGPSAGIG